MRIRTLAGAVTAGTVLTATALMAGAGTAQASPARGLGTTSLATVLGADGVKFDKKGGDFDIVEAAVYAVAAAKPKSPVLILADGTKRATAFAPTDRASRRLVKDLTGTSYASEAKVFSTLAGLVDIDTLETVLLYHVVPGATITAAQALKSNGAKLTTAAGVKLTVKVKDGHVMLVDKDPDAANATVIVPDINKGNRQIAHGIDTVLRPKNL
ncbi:MAG: fasciclin domain-containing protein [Nocardioides sp.]